MNKELQQKVKDELKIILVSISISFLYMILSLMEFIFTYPFNDHTYHPILWTEGIAIYVLIFCMPVILLLFYTIPSLIKKKRLKRFFIYFTLSSWTLVFVYQYLSGIIYNLKVQ